MTFFVVALCCLWLLSIYRQFFRSRRCITDWMNGGQFSLRFFTQLEDTVVVDSFLGGSENERAIKRTHLNWCASDLPTPRVDLSQCFEVMHANEPGGGEGSLLFCYCHHTAFLCFRSYIKTLSKENPSLSVLRDHRVQTTRLIELSKL